MNHNDGVSSKPNQPVANPTVKPVASNPIKEDELAQATLDENKLAESSLESTEEEYTPDPFGITKKSDSLTGMPVMLSKFDEITRQLTEASNNGDKEAMATIGYFLHALSYNNFRGVKDIEDSTALARTSVFNAKLKGEISPDKVASVIGRGIGLNGRTTVWLPYCGVWATVKAPSPIAFAAYARSVDTMIEEGNLRLYTYPHSSTLALFCEGLLDLIVDNIVQISVADVEISTVINVDTITAPDLSVLLMAVLNSKYSSGYEIEAACVACNSTTPKTVVLSKTLRYSLPEELTTHPAYLGGVLRSKHVGLDVVEDYRSVCKRVTSKTITLNDNEEAIFTTPTLTKWSSAAIRQSEKINDILYELMIGDENAKELGVEIANSLSISHLANHTSRINLLNFDEDTPEEDRPRITTREGILQAFEVLGEDNETAGRLLKESLDWTANELVEAVLPIYSCPTCLATEDNDVTVKSTFQEYIPLDVLGFFTQTLLKHSIAD